MSMNSATTTKLVELTDAELDHVAGGVLSNAFSTAIQAIGEGLSSMARKA